jgi:hypothetical protein
MTAPHARKPAKRERLFDERYDVPAVFIRSAASNLVTVGTLLDAQFPKEDRVSKLADGAVMEKASSLFGMADNVQKACSNLELARPERALELSKEQRGKLSGRYVAAVKRFVAEMTVMDDRAAEIKKKVKEKSATVKETIESMDILIDDVIEGIGRFADEFNPISKEYFKNGEHVENLLRSKAGNGDPPTGMFG